MKLFFDESGFDELVFYRHTVVLAPLRNDKKKQGSGAFLPPKLKVNFGPAFTKKKREKHFGPRLKKREKTRA